MGDGVEALKKLRYARFDVLLTDLMMTAVGSDDLRQQALQAGADEFLIKPYESADLIQVLSDGFSRFTQPEPEVSVIKPVRINDLPPFFLGCDSSRNRKSVEPSPTF